MEDIELGRLLGEQAEATRGLTTAVNELKEQVGTLIADKNQREGGRKAMYTIAGVLGTVGGAVGSAIASWYKGP